MFRWGYAGVLVNNSIQHVSHKRKIRKPRNDLLNCFSWTVAAFYGVNCKLTCERERGKVKQQRGPSWSLLSVRIETVKLAVVFWLCSLALQKWPLIVLKHRVIPYVSYFVFASLCMNSSSSVVLEVQLCNEGWGTWNFTEGSDDQEFHVCSTLNKQQNVSKDKTTPFLLWYLYGNWNLPKVKRRINGEVRLIDNKQGAEEPLTTEETSGKVW